MGVKKRPRCFFDVTISGTRVGRVIFELFSDITPITCENFRGLCTGEKGLGKKTGKPLHYVGCTFHRVVKDFMVQSGDFSDGNGKGGESIYGGTFEDENFDMKHDKPFLLSMANKGPNTNGSQFFILTQPAPHLDGIHTVFGHVISGKEIISEIEVLQVDKKNRPMTEARIFNSGELVPKSKAKKEEESSSDSSSSSEDEEDDKEKKRAKKEKKKSKKEKKKAKMAEKNGVDEEGEAHPLVTLTKIDPDEIPDVPKNRFLNRQRSPSKSGSKSRSRSKSRRRRSRSGSRRRRSRSRSRRGRSGSRRRSGPRKVGGKKVKGRGSMMFRANSRSRSRSITPIHWKQAERRTVSMAEYEKTRREKEKREKERERREEERKRDEAHPYVLYILFVYGNVEILF
ncbi:peptidyl-prolyl cis-trans isomerase G-like [Eurytemora carolleeae]|uniref:peptidyl-prolyl cis-trans isomerase G-like n=1 Tax=Eurytemora carolleeae TaxID=1294199 RepID=UPI000C77DC56|nr:peptidyl-prolyl cis-trans isomerase G-like [Eurytemora carolleeae]|eukprot:XP_023327582.1 peptidyl-prolyl cis-trans isomerase G-like [Eurytemora affinis]